MNQIRPYYVSVGGPYRVLEYIPQQPLYFLYPNQMVWVAPESAVVPIASTFQPEISGIKEESRPIPQIKSQVERILKSQLLSQRDDSSEEKHRRRSPAQRQSKKKIQKGQVRPQRSALTNIGNQLLTYLYIQKKNCRVIRRMFPQLKEEELANYYQFARRLKECMYGYFNQQKLKKLWEHNPSDQQDKLNNAIVRRLTFYYMRQLLVLAIMTSKKMPSDVKPLHLKIRRNILKLMSSTFHASQFQ